MIKHHTKQWEVTLIALKYGEGIKYKVTRTIPAPSVAETMLFDSKEDAQKQFDAWLQ